MKKIISFCLISFLSCTVLADVKLPEFFGDHMVLQRDKPIPIWGWADPGEKITILFNHQTKKIRTGKNGKWMVTLGTEIAGGPYILTVKGKNTFTASDVYVGEVWICSGQSNMEMPIAGWGEVNNYETEIADANYPMIRHIKIPKTINTFPQENISAASWEICSPATAGEFTAAGYFFARELFRHLKVPVGLINSSWGGTMVETWTSKQAFENSDEFKTMIADMPQISLDSLQNAKDAALNKTTNKTSIGPNSYPTLLFNAMINPLIPYSMRGVIWYQGEANAGRANQYSKAFPLLINDWRSCWHEGDFPFYFVQLASFNAGNGNSKKGSTWAELREAQTHTLSLPNTGMAITTDIGDPTDIHPKNKQDVGKRLAAIALNKVYGENNEYSGPVYTSMSAEGNKVRISFAHTGTGLMVKDRYGYIKGFEVAGADKVFHYAKAEIDGNNVVVYSDDVTSPVAARYGWCDDAGDNNLFNKEGFPAGPFRTDNWTGITENSKFKIKR